VNLTLQFNPTTAGTATGQLTVSSNSSSNPTAAVALSGTGTAQAYEVDLSWNAPSNSSDPVTGYNIYRAPTGTTNYQLLNPSQNSPTAYADTSVQSGQTYDYIVKSVDAANLESSPSNTTTVSIP
jgi:fibronectin type 3 domain-containing protein